MFETCSAAVKAAKDIRCDAILNTSACDSDGFMQYTSYVYCSDHFGVGILVLVIMLLIYFMALSATADGFFVPSLAVIVDQLKISENIAGVTFMAFGNGAPDIFASIAAVTSSQKAKPTLMFGALIGAGIFVTTIVVGAVTLIRPFDIMQRPFLRDVIFYLWACFYAFYVMYDGKISLGESIGFIAVYIVYVLVVLLGRYLRRSALTKEGVDVDNVNFGEIAEEVERKHSEASERRKKSSVSQPAEKKESLNNQDSSSIPDDPEPSSLKSTVPTVVACTLKALPRRDSLIEEIQFPYHAYFPHKTSGLAELGFTMTKDEDGMEVCTLTPTSPPPFYLSDITEDAEMDPFPSDGVSPVAIFENSERNKSTDILVEDDAEVPPEPVLPARPPFERQKTIYDKGHPIWKLYVLLVWFEFFFSAALCVMYVLVFGDFYASVYTPDDEVSASPQLDSFTPIYQDLVAFSSSALLFTCDVISKKLKSSNAQSSPGPDDISPKVLKRFHRTLSIPLRLIFQKSWDTEAIPDDWKVAYVIPVYKGKGNTTSVKNYRPISLTSHVSKVMESIVKEWMIGMLQASNSISNVGSLTKTVATF